MMDTVEGLAKALEVAIADGDVDVAVRLTQQLGELRARLSIEQKRVNPNEPDDEITLRVHLEDKDTSGPTIPFKVRPSDTIRHLKRQMRVKYSFPEQVQTWIIGKRLPKDGETLYQCGVHSDDTSVFLYLMSSQSVGLTREEFNRQQRDLQQRDLQQCDLQQRDLQQRDLQQQNARQLEGHDAPLNVSSSQPAVASASNNLSSMTAVMTVTHDIQRPTPPESLESKPEASAFWACPGCTYNNLPTRPGCEICGHERPVDYEVPENYVVPEYEEMRLQEEQANDEQVRQAEERLKNDQKLLGLLNYQKIMETDNRDLVTNTEPFTCPICYERLAVGEGVVLRECLHSFCRECLVGVIQYAEEAGVKCPFQDNAYSCDQLLQEREVKALAPYELYEKFLQRSLATAESQAANSYHCKTADCKGWCLYEYEVNFFQCEVCGKVNCLTCRAIHEGLNCKEYQDEINRKATIDVAARQTQEALNAMLAAKDAMHCPQCGVIIQKKDGCDGVQCSICRTDICWATKGPRWGPRGVGDTSGGCKCGVNGRRCHPDCMNCH